MSQGALRFLIQARFRNWWRAFRRRARAPRYLIIYLLGAGYIWLVFVGPIHVAQASARTSQHALDFMAAIFTLTAMRWWITEKDRGPLAFTAAELTFLFPAPITRRQLILFKLVRVQFLLLLSALLSSLLARRTGIGATAWILRALAFWVCYGTLYLHRLGAALTRAALAERGSVGWWRRAALILFTSVAIAIPALFVIRQWPQLAEAWRSGLVAFFTALGALVNQPVVAVVIWPVRTLLAPTIAPDLLTWARRMVPSLGLLLLHVLWVTRADHRFEEAAVEASSRRARRLARQPGRGDSPPPRGLPLPGWASPAVAVAWKNLQAQLRSLSRPTILALGVPVIGTLVFGMMEPEGSLREVIGWFALFWSGFLVVIGPQWVRYDLRRDLARIDVLRSYPVPGSAVVAGEILASAVILSVYQLILLVLALWGLWAAAVNAEVPAPLLLGGYLGLILVLPLLNWLAVGIYNAGALLFPEWVRRGPRAPGIETTGQNLMALLSTVILLALAGAVPLGTAASVIYLGMDRLGPAVLIPAAVLAALGLGLEARWFAAWLGRRFEAYDPSAVRLRIEG
ncbi:MAG TPA: putative ABC exporter domain-containing protein [Gemmatimonadales bacterium]|nr:putative ABC exporter domain-containing protein [Gemmatimonadales bacterium]